MTEIETRKLLLQLAQLLRAHFEYLHTLHDSTIALFDVLRKKNPEIDALPAASASTLAASPGANSRGNASQY